MNCNTNNNKNGDIPFDIELVMFLRGESMPESDDNDVKAATIFSSKKC